MSNELQLVDESAISVESKTEINEDLDRIISLHKNNRQAINRLVFESIAAMTTADEAQVELANKGWLKRGIGSITGSNARLQNRINASRAEAMYASQQTLQKLAEQNLMTFDLIAAVNNKLNASMLKVGEEFGNIYRGLAKFFKTNRSELARLEARLEKMERNLSLLNWQNSIEYQEFDGVEYIDLDDVSKIVCLVRDFYDITKGEWSNSDLLLLKSAMRDVDIHPKDNINYGEVLKELSYNERLKEYMLDGRTIQAIEDPSYLLSLGYLKKHEMLNDEESYMVDTLVDQMSSMGVDAKRNVVCDQLTSKYLANKAFVDVNVNVECYDLILDLLYNIRQAKDEELLIGTKKNNIDTDELLALGRGYLNGDGVEQDDVKAYSYFQQAADLGNAEAMVMMGRFYRDAMTVAKDYSKALEWFERAATLGDASAMRNIGLLYCNGQGVVQDYSKAMEWLKKAADLNDASAMRNIGLLYRDGQGVIQDYSKSIEWLKKAADLDDIRALNLLGWYYTNGDGVEQDDVKAYSYFQQAAGFGNPDAMGMIGHFYYDGLAVMQDYNKALEWYRKAADLGNDDAMRSIGNLYDNGLGVMQDYRKAMEWYKKAADLGNIRAMYNIGFLYDRGDCYSKAMEWYQKAADLGDADAIRKIGLLYYFGHGVAQDYNKAMEWYQKAADLGNAIAMRNIGNLYCFGHGITQNYSKAIEWYQKAVELGDEKALNCIADVERKLAEIRRKLDEDNDSLKDKIIDSILDWL